MIRSMRLILM